MMKQSLVLFLVALLLCPAASLAQTSGSTMSPAPMPAETPAPAAAEPACAGEGSLPRDQNFAMTYDLAATVERGLKFNPQIMAARAQLLGADYGRKSALGAFGPAASMRYSYNRLGEAPTQRSMSGVNPVTGQPNYTTRTGSNDVWTLSFNITQPIFTGFNLLSTYQKSVLTQEQSEAQLSQAELELILAVQESFLLLLKARMDVKNAEDSVARLQSQLKVTQAFYDVGLKPRLDVLQAEVDLATAQQQLLIARNSVATQTAQLNALLDLPLENPTQYVGELSYVPFSMSLDDCVAQADKHRPSLLIGRKSVEIAQKNVKITASDFYPQVSAQWQYSQTGDTATASGSSLERTGYSDWSVGAAVNWTFFEWGKTYNAVQQSKETVSQLEAQLERTRLDVGYEVKASLLAIREAADRIGVARKSVEAGLESFRQAEARYQNQVGTSTEVLDAQSRVSDAQAQLAQALSDYMTSLAKLYASMGDHNPSLAPR